MIVQSEPEFENYFLGYYSPTYYKKLWLFECFPPFFYIHHFFFKEHIDAGPRIQKHNETNEELVQCDKIIFNRIYLYI